MRHYEIFELRHGWISYLRQRCPGVPDYILQDFITKVSKMKNGASPRNFNIEKEGDDYHFSEYLNMQIDAVNKYSWKLETLIVSLDIFTIEDQRRLRERLGTLGKDWGGVPKDAERHNVQQKLIANSPSREPIIIIKNSDGYELLEGWHRTIQSLNKWKEYKQIAYVGYPK